MAICKEGGISPKGKLEIPIIGFKDNKKLDGIPNENFPQSITKTMSKFNLSRIIINGGSLCDIMYAELFEKLGLRKEKLYPYMCSEPLSL